MHGLGLRQAKQICVRKDAANDSDLYEQGRALAVAGEYERALDLLTSVRNQNDAMVLTMIGYSKRKMGAVDEGIGYYHKALAIEPDNVLTREYLGEGYVMMGRIDLAQAELNQIEAICGDQCEQYQRPEGGDRRRSGLVAVGSARQSTASRLEKRLDGEGKAGGRRLTFPARSR